MHKKTRALIRTADHALV